MYWFPESSALTVNVGFKGTSWSKDDFNSRWFPEHKCGQAPSDHWGSLQSAGEHTLQVVVVVVSRDVRERSGRLAGDLGGSGEVSESTGFEVGPGFVFLC